MAVRSVLSGFVLLLGLLVSPMTAQAAAPDYTNYFYIAGAGATQVKALGSTVTSDPTTPSVISGWKVPNRATNTTASTSLRGIVSTGAVTSVATSQRAGDGVALFSRARTAGVNILSGLITADVLETVASATLNRTTHKGSANTRFVGLKVAGADIDVAAKGWFAVDDVLQLSINGVQTKATRSGVFVIGYGLGIRLLKDVGRTPAGTVIYVNPVFLATVPQVPTPKSGMHGQAHAARVLVDVGSGGLKVESGPVARHVISGSTKGRTTSNTAVDVNLPEVLRSQTVRSFGASDRSDGTRWIRMGSALKGLNLFRGLIRADAIRVTARSEMSRTGHKTTFSSRFVNLRIGRFELPITPRPNTTLDIAGLGKVVVNQRVRRGFTASTTGLRITLDTRRAGLPVGSVIEVAFAKATAW